MLQLKYYSFELAFEFPFTTHKGTKTAQPTLITSLGLANMTGYGEAPGISYYNVTVPDMIAALEAKRGLIERYALIDPGRFWHFLHHLLPGHNFLIAALDTAGWDLFSQMRRQPLYSMLGLKWENAPKTDYTIGNDTVENMVAKVKAKPWPVYKIKLGSTDDLAKLEAIRKVTDAPVRVDANEGWTFEEAKQILPELVKLGVQLIEQPLNRTEWDAMKELKALSPIPLFADESCVTEQDVAKCAAGFDGINIKLTKCGGITPAVRMIKEARALGLKVMMGNMNESTIGTAAIANMLPLIDEADADGPLLLRQDIAEGLTYDNGILKPSGRPGLGIRITGLKDRV